VQKLAGDVRALRASVEAFGARANQTGKIAAAVDTLTARLDAAKSETSALISALADKIERARREPEEKHSQLLSRLDRMEQRFSAPAALGSTSASAAPPASAAQKQTQFALAAGKLPAEPENGQRKPRLITNWIVRDAYDGIALVESSRGAIEVAPGETIPGAGKVKSIERRGAGWIVITSQGIVDSAYGTLLP